MLTTASTVIHGANSFAVSPNSSTTKRNIANVPTLSMTAIISTPVDGVPATAASGSQACSGHTGALTANAKKLRR